MKPLKYTCVLTFNEEDLRFILKYVYFQTGFYFWLKECVSHLPKGRVPLETMWFISNLHCIFSSFIYLKCCCCFFFSCEAPESCLSVKGKRIPWHNDWWQLHPGLLHQEARGSDPLWHTLVLIICVLTLTSSPLIRAHKEERVRNGVRHEDLCGTRRRGLASRK